MVVLSPKAKLTDEEDVRSNFIQIESKADGHVGRLQLRQREQFMVEVDEVNFFAVIHRQLETFKGNFIEVEHGQLVLQTYWLVCIHCKVFLHCDVDELLLECLLEEEILHFRKRHYAHLTLVTHLKGW